MPPIIPAIAAGIAGAMASAGVITGIGTLASVIGGITTFLTAAWPNLLPAGASMALGAVSKALTGKPKQSGSLGTFQDRTQAVRQPITARRVIYGKVRVSGVYTFIHSTVSNQYIHLVLTLSGHPIEAIDTVYFGDEAIPLDVDGNATGKYAGNVVIRKGLGTTVGDSNLLAALIANCPDVWTANHRQSGCAKLYVRLKYNQTLFPNGIPNISCIVRGKQ